MSTDTVLTDADIKAAHDSLNYTYTYPEFARAIEQAVLQSPEIQALKKDAERLDHLERELNISRYAIDAAMEKQK